MEPEAPRVNRRRLEFDADLGDRVPLHVAHDEFHSAEARPVSDRGCPAKPVCQKLVEGDSGVGGRCRIIEVCDRGERGSSVERKLAEKPAIIRPAALGTCPEHAIEHRKILRACEREHVVAGSERWGGRGTASNAIPNYHQNTRRRRERQCLYGFGGGSTARLHSIACHSVLVAEAAGEIDVQTGRLLERRHVQIEHPRGRRDRSWRSVSS